MKLIGTWLSPYASRVLIAARFKGIDLATTRPSDAELSSLTPIGKIPVLVDGPLVLPESEVILEYLDERFPAPTIFPGAASDSANVRVLTRLMDSYSAPSFGPFLAGDQPGIATATERIDKALLYVDHFRTDGEFASGGAFSAADCALIPFFHIFERLQDGFGTFDLVRKHPKLEAWWSRARGTDIGMFARGEIDKAISERLQGG